VLPQHTEQPQEKARLAASGSCLLWPALLPREVPFRADVRKYFDAN